MNPITIYALYCPATGRARYIGMTRDLKRRLTHYRWGGHTPHLTNWLRTLDRSIPCRILALVEPTEADRTERVVIALFRSRGQADLNYSDGGEAGYTQSSAHRAKLRVLRQTEWQRTGLPMLSPTARAKARLTLKGKPKPAGWGARFTALNIARRGIPLRPEHVANVQAAKRAKNDQPGGRSTITESKK